MKPEEAIEQFKKHKLCDSTGFHNEDDAEAEALAIEALEIMCQTCKTCLYEYNCQLRDEYDLEYCSEWQSEIIKDGEDDE